ncbi:LysR family transcriptional regulator [Sphingobium subterraneum]|uniref:DNA-binding transcriptional LysR family regulator n=1 Tax=Sphingobium subterraneum TaxID=627688 RepID=A0A841IZR8_9SPHN|nr:LysR family transcriptional regulator [Sphingobium subterraneum]MBB6123612.1 DNA-binding transcriptional LysR family regulator [Sphingobium subterraneum]
MLRTKLNDILVFMAIADAGSFVSGGQAMGLTRSAAGKAISRLEERLGVRLLNRTTRKLSLTDEGRAFYDHGLRVLAAVEDAESSVAGNTGTPRGLLRITVPDAFGRLVILPLLKDYLEAWPHVQMEVSLTDRVVDIVEEGFDLAIRIGVTHSDSRLISRVIASYTVLMCASPAYLERRGEPRSVKDLADHECLLFSSKAQRQAWRLRTEDGTVVRVTGHNRLRLDSGEAIRDAAVAGLGIALLPEFLLESQIASSGLHAILTDITSTVDIVLLYPSKKFIEPRARTFMDWIIRNMADRA